MMVVCYLKTLSASVLYSVGDRTVKEYGAVDGIRTGRENTHHNATF
jgi:hypothetical protein